MRVRLADIRRQCRRHASLSAAVLLAILAARHQDATRRIPAAQAAAPVVAVVWPEAAPAPSPAPNPGLTVLVSEGGAPVIDAEVAISDGSRAVLATARTDRDGLARFAELAPGPYELWATRETEAPRASQLARVELAPEPSATSERVELAPEPSATSERVELALVPASRVRGEIALDLGGEVPPGATVQLVPIDVDHAMRTASLDERGRFEVAALPPGRWRIEAAVPGYVQAEGAIVDARAAEATVALELVRAGSIAGTVVDTDGNPVANATITLRDDAGTSLWPFELAPARTRWIHPLAGARELPANVSTRFGAVRAGSRPAECGRGHCGVDLGDERGHVVHAVADGAVAALFPEDRTEAGRVVAIHHGNGLRTMYMHLDEIRPGLEVGQRIRAGEPLGTVGSTGILRSVPHLHFAITQEHRGRTWYVDPEPMLRHAVVLGEPRAFDPVDPTQASAPLSVEPAAAVARITTDARGAFRIDGVAPGSYVAVAFAQDLAPGTSTPIDVRSNEHTEGVAIALHAGALVQGRVLGPHGAIASASVIASTGMGASSAKVASTHTDKHGEFTLRALGGKVTLAVQASGYTTGERTIVIDDRAPTRTTRTRLREEFSLTIEDAKLRGQILAPDGGAAAGVGVRVVEGISRRTTVTDATGRFELAPVASGRYVVELASSDHPRKRVAIDTTRWAELRLDRGGALRAIVRARNGDPIATTRVVARGPSNQAIERVTDARGVLELRGLPAGTWKLSARARGYSVATRDVTVRAGGSTPDVLLELTRAATIAGVARDRFGRRVAGARITFGGVSAVAGGDGTFHLADVPSGAGVIEAEHDELRGVLPVELAPGDERRSLTIELR